MSFLYPWLLLLIPLALWLMRGTKQRSSVTVASTKLWPEQFVGRARFLWIPVALRRLTICLLLLALARPQAGSTDSVEVSEGIAIQMLVDISSSMDMSITDKQGNRTTRMEVAKEMVASFIAGDGEVLQGRPNDLVGLITFARYADTRSPLTLGHEALLQIVRNLEIQQRPNEDGTAYGDALAIAAARLHKLEELKASNSANAIDDIQSRVIILLTDGENNSGAHLPIEAAGLAKEWGCHIYAISLGDAANLANPDSNSTPLNSSEKVLEFISKETGGIFRQAYDFESLRSVYKEIDALERSKIRTKSFERVDEWFWLPLTAAIIALLLALGLEATILRVVP